MTEGNRQREQESKRPQYRPPNPEQDILNGPLRRTQPWLHSARRQKGLDVAERIPQTRGVGARRCEDKTWIRPAGPPSRLHVDSKSPIDRREASAAPMVQSLSSPSPVGASFPRTQHADGGTSISAVCRALLLQDLSCNVGPFWAAAADQRAPSWRRMRRSWEPYRRKKLALERVQNPAKGKTPGSTSCE